MRSHTFTTSSSSSISIKSIPIHTKQGIYHYWDKAHFSIIELPILSALATSKSIIGHFEKESIESLAQCL